MFTFLSIKDYHSDLLSNRCTCEEAVQHYLERIDSCSHLNAFIDVYKNEALNRAKELDQERKKGLPLGLLHGVIVALKDVISHKGHSLTAASNILKGFKAIYDATAVKKLLDEGAIIIGSTNCDEFAMGSTNENSAYGKTFNGINPAHVPGGSSGGAAVAIQMGCCMLSLGSDTGGSVRQPADFCGVLGIKPTYGRISRYGLIAYASSFDQIGIFGNSVNDLALSLEVISGPDDYDSTAHQHPPPYFTKDLSPASAKSLKIAYFKEAFESSGLDTAIAAAMYRTVENLKKDGHQVEPVSFEYLDYIVPTYYILTTAEASSNLSRFDGVRYGNRNVDKNGKLSDFYSFNRSDGFGWEVKKRIMLGSFVLSAGYFDAYFTRAQQVRNLLVQKTNLIFSEFDALILPTAPTPAFRIGEKMEDPIAMYMADIFTVFANLTGIPGISLPLYKHPEGLPFGLQVMTNRFSELSLLRISEDWISRYKEY